MLLNRFDEDKLNNIVDVNYLWYFPNQQKIYKYLPYAMLCDMIMHLNSTETNNLIKLLYTKDWYGCFGVTSIITLEFLETVQNRFNFLNLVNYVTCRKEREALERIFALCCYSIINTNKYYLNNIMTNYNSFKITYDDYMNQYIINKWNNVGNIIKVWYGR
jgi:hypothetical protein